MILVGIRDSKINRLEIKGKAFAFVASALSSNCVKAEEGFYIEEKGPAHAKKIFVVRGKPKKQK